MWYSAKNPEIFTIQIFSLEWWKWHFSTLVIIWRKDEFHNLNSEMMEINNKVNFLKLFLFNFEEQTFKYQSTLQICRLNVNLLLILLLFFRAKTRFSFCFYEIIYRMVAITIGLVTKITTVKNRIWISSYHFMMLWKAYQNFYLFTKYVRHSWNVTPAH